MNLIDIARQLQDATVAALNARGIETERNASNVLCLLYVVVKKEVGDEFEEFKIRFSDHADRYGSDLTIRIDGSIEDEFDEFGEWVSSSIEAWKAEEMVKEAVSAAVAWING